jgi:hypothetical protein
MQDYVTALPLGALIAAHAACVASVIAISRARQPAYPGWRVVGPSGAHWFCLAGAWGFGALISWVWLFVGSSRADADSQMKVALGLAIVFCMAGTWGGFQIAALRRKALRWRGGDVIWRERGEERRQEFAQFDSLRRGWGGDFQIRFKDQTVLKLDFNSWSASPKRSERKSTDRVAALLKPVRPHKKDCGSPSGRTWPTLQGTFRDSLP